MAEKSFWKDKKDTKWVSNFLFYYKNYILSILFILLLALHAFSSCKDKVFYDLEVNYISALYANENAINRAEKEFAEIIDDADGRDGRKVIFNNHVIPKDGAEDANTIADKTTKMQLEVAEGEGYLYLMSEDYADFCANFGVMEDISKYLGEAQPCYFIDASDTEMLKSLVSVQNEKLCVGLRKLNNSRTEDKLQQKKHSNAVKALKHIINQKR